jgi:hypothetical protein
MKRTRKFASVLLVNSLIRSLTERLERLLDENKPRKGVVKRASNEKRSGEPKLKEKIYLEKKRKAEKKSKIEIKDSVLIRTNVG